MQIKQQQLAQNLKKRIAPLYLLIGQDNYLLEDSVTAIKTAIKARDTSSLGCDEKTLSIQSAQEWNKITEEANSYSLFSDTVLLTVIFDKKSLDATGKKILLEYLNSINSRCFIIIKAPNIPARQVQWLATQEQAVLTVAYPLKAEEVKNWIAAQFKKNALQYDPQVPELIYQYTQGNMLACAQAIEKIALSHSPACKISLQQAQEQLSNQCDHELFELTESCLLGQADKVIQIVRHAANNKSEATLVLWILSQEIRIMMQISYLMEQKKSIRESCTQLKIWPQRISHYQACWNRWNKSVCTSFDSEMKPEAITNKLLQELHHHCYILDERIKSNANTQIWNTLEYIALSLCLGQLPGDACIV